MANPQIEQGYLKIANSIYSAFCKTRINGEARQILDCIIRQTYGYNQKGAIVNLDRFAEMTGLGKPNIVRGINKLKHMGLIIKTDNGKYVFQKDFEKWKPLSKLITPSGLSKRIIKIIQTDNKRLSKRIIITDEPKDKGLKDNIKDKLLYTLPDKLKVLSGFTEAWQEWIQYRKEIKKPVKSTTAKMQLKFLSEQQNPITTINNSILQGWQGLFVCKDNASCPTTLQSPETKFILDTFKKSFGFFPTDKNNIQEADKLSEITKNYIKSLGKEVTEERFQKAISFLFDRIKEKDYSANIEKMSTIILKSNMVFVKREEKGDR